jgi:WD40 repeat protein
MDLVRKRELFYADMNAYSCVFSPDSTMLAVAKMDGSVAYYDAETGVLMTKGSIDMSPSEQVTGLKKTRRTSKPDKSLDKSRPERKRDSIIGEIVRMLKQM